VCDYNKRIHPGRPGICENGLITPSDHNYCEDRIRVAKIVFLVSIWTPLTVLVLIAAVRLLMRRMLCAGFLDQWIFHFTATPNLTKWLLHLLSFSWTLGILCMGLTFASSMNNDALLLGVFATYVVFKEYHLAVEHFLSHVRTDLYRGSVNIPIALVVAGNAIISMLATVAFDPADENESWEIAFGALLDTTVVVLSFTMRECYQDGLLRQFMSHKSTPVVLSDWRYITFKNSTGWRAVDGGFALLIIVEALVVLFYFTNAHHSVINEQNWGFVLAFTSIARTWVVETFQHDSEATQGTHNEHHEVLSEPLNDLDFEAVHGKNYHRPAEQHEEEPPQPSADHVEGVEQKDS